MLFYLSEGWGRGRTPQRPISQAASRSESGVKDGRSGVEYVAPKRLGSRISEGVELDS